MKLKKYLAPEWLILLVNTLSESLNEKNYEVNFYNNLPNLIDYDKLKIDFTIVVLESSLDSLNNVKFDKEKHPDILQVVNQSKAAVVEMIRCFKSGESTTAASAAASAARSAAESAAWSAAKSAASAAESAESAAESAAWSAVWSAARSAKSAARKNRYKHFDRELKRLIKEQE
jgi:hypothetical protein